MGLSRLDGWPARSPADASSLASRPDTHGSGPTWIATPSSYRTLTDYSWPVSRRTTKGRWLTQVVNGYFAYHAVPTNRRALMAFRHHVTDLWRRTLRRRSQKDRLTWARMAKVADAWLPRPHLLHPWPSERFAVRHPRWEPSARIGPARICAGGAQ